MIKIKGDTVIDNELDFFGRDATFTRDVTIDDDLTVGDNLTVTDKVTIQGGISDGNVLVVQEGRMSLGPATYGAGYWLERSSQAGSGYWFVGLADQDSTTTRWWNLEGGTVMDLSKDGDLNISGVFDGEINGENLDLGTNYPCFKVILTEDQELTGGNTWCTVLFDSGSSHRSFDIGDNYGMGYFVAPVAGIYEFSWQLALHKLDESSEYAGFRALHCSQGGIEKSRHGSSWETAGGYYIGHMGNGNTLGYPISEGSTFMVNMLQYDHVRIQAKVNDVGDGDPNVYVAAYNHNTTALSYFSGKLISRTSG